MVRINDFKNVFFSGGVYMNGSRIYYTTTTSYSYPICTITSHSPKIKITQFSMGVKNEVKDVLDH